MLHQYLKTLTIGLVNILLILSFVFHFQLCLLLVLFYEVVYFFKLQFRRNVELFEKFLSVYFTEGITEMLLISHLLGQLLT